MMDRIFLFILRRFDYSKSDLNKPFSEKRNEIGQISRMLTNAIFLSHSLRQQTVVRLFILEPSPYLIEIKTETIRYLGPELRSSASILLKAKNYLFEKITEDKALDIWYEPNPGLFSAFTNNALLDLNDVDKFTIFQFQKTSSDDNSVSITDVEESVLNSDSTNKSLMFIFYLDEELYNLTKENVIINRQKQNLVYIDSKILFPNLVGLLNLFIDKKEGLRLSSK